MNQSVPEKVALVTGGGKRRVGNVIAQALAARGFAVALHYNRSAAEARQSLAGLRAAGVRAEAFQADVSDEASVAQMYQEMMKTFGRLDVLVTAAAVWNRRPLEETTAADVRREFEVNALGTFLCCQHAGRIMVGQPAGGAIVTIGDWACARPYGNYAAYFLSKGAIPTLTRALAIELAARNRAVRVNCILPGPVMLPENLSPPEVQGIVAGTLLKRLGRPENIAQAAVFFVENDYVTGACLPVDGGRTIAESGSF